MSIDQPMTIHLAGFPSGYTKLGLVFWLLVLVAAVGFLVSILRD
ncbi:MAG: hypothetical protein U5S82_14970 [Gammaproteobacteria bacterium]|nr:hypothetical protein [Gammaproteobacteria bacterium]